MPAYNEQDNIELAVQEVCCEVLDDLPGAYLIVVDDGSKDDTGLILDRISANDPRVRVIHKQNGGHGPALVAALNSADSEYVFLVDSDMQIPLKCFSQLWDMAKQPGVDGVFGVRENRQDPKARILLSAFIALALTAMFQVRLTDANAPCKVFRRKIWTEMYAKVNDDSMMAPSLVLAIYALRHKFKIISVKVSHRERARGETSLRLPKLIKFCWRAFGQVVRLKEQIS